MKCREITSLFQIGNANTGVHARRLQLSFNDATVSCRTKGGFPVHPSNSALHLFLILVLQLTQWTLWPIIPQHTLAGSEPWRAQGAVGSRLPQRRLILSCARWRPVNLVLRCLPFPPPPNPTWWPFDISTDGVSFMCTHSDLPPRRYMLQGKIEFLRIYNKPTLMIHVVLWIPFKKISADEKISPVCGSFVIQYAVYIYIISRQAWYGIYRIWGWINDKTEFCTEENANSGVFKCLRHTSVLHPCSISSQARNMDENVTRTSLPEAWSVVGADQHTAESALDAFSACITGQKVFGSMQHRSARSRPTRQLGNSRQLISHPISCVGGGNTTVPHDDAFPIDVHFVQSEFVWQRHVGCSVLPCTFLLHRVSSTSFGWLATEWQQWP